ncbi:MAG: pyrroline-5-carboxylate reductase [Desulfobacterales bacterium]|uniref:Pyrroline-5-carboxylate reductase n=1 Tax=Candidatus Desulfatibia vada TaxID=2841696 RepID=A0A8J6NUF1_9BACT|nr:pyrroline-5-carboxylate reductase [Candidatus Desulfatibia vada]
MLKDKTISMIGTGNMGEALVSGLISSKSTAAENIICTDIREDQLESVKEKYGVAVTTNNLDAVKASEIIIYAVKPQIIAPVLIETASKLDMSKLVISIAAGVPLAAIESCLKKKLRLIRVMPNIAAFVKESATVVAAGENASQDDVKMAMAIFDSMGKTIFLKENALMDAVTGLSGSGPAYIFLIVDALADAGVKVGLARQDALFLATQTVLGAAKLLMETKEHPGKLKDMVTSPGGTAIAGLHTLEKGGLRTTLMDAVEAATKRSQELGEIITKNFSNNS